MKTALWSDLKTDDERSAFFLSGRAYETGVVCHSIQNDLAMAYHRLAEMQKELRRLDVLNTELVEVLSDVTASLVAAHNLLQNGGKKAAASDKMFSLMLNDYEKSFELGRAVLAKAKEQT